MGYGPPADKHLEKIQNAIAGIDTYGALNARYAKEPANVEVLFKLARKCGDRYSTELTAKSQELYRKVVALDPEGKQGSYFNESIKATIPYTQAAEYALGQMASSGRKADPAPLRAFIAKYPDSKLVKNVYANLSYYYGYQAGKDDAAKFFEEYMAKYSEDRQALSSYVQRIIKDKEPLDKGIALAEKLLTTLGETPIRNADVVVFDQARNGFNLSVTADLLIRKGEKQFILHTKRLPEQFLNILKEAGKEVIPIGENDQGRSLIEGVLKGLGIPVPFGYFSFRIPEESKRPRLSGSFSTLQVMNEGEPIYLIDFDMPPAVLPFLNGRRGGRVVRY